MKPFFGLMYYAALHPEEASDLRRVNLVSLPRRGWGEMILTHSVPRSGSHWTDSGKPREPRALKHRADGDTRRVPIHPELVAMLREHLDEFGTGPHGRLSRALAAGSSPTGRISRCSTRAALKPSPPRRPARRCWMCLTPCVMRRCLPGSTPGLLQPKLRSGPGTASPCSSASMPSVSPVSRTRPCAESPMRLKTTDASPTAKTMTSRQRRELAHPGHAAWLCPRQALGHGRDTRSRTETLTVAYNRMGHEQALTAYVLVRAHFPC